MSLKSAVKIFTEQGFKDPQWAVAVIQKARTLEELSQIMGDEHTCSSAEFELAIQEHLESLTH